MRDIVCSKHQSRIVRGAEEVAPGLTPALPSTCQSCPPNVPSDPNNLPSSRDIFADALRRIALANMVLLPSAAAELLMSQSVSARGFDPWAFNNGWIGFYSSFAVGGGTRRVDLFASWHGRNRSDRPRPVRRCHPTDSGRLRPPRGGLPDGSALPGCARHRLLVIPGFDAYPAADDLLPVDVSRR